MNLRIFANIFRLSLIICLVLSVYKIPRVEAQKQTESMQEAASVSPEQHKPITGKYMSPIYKFKAKALDGSEIDFDRYKGKVILIVNTASECGFTPQYDGLEKLSKKYGPRGLEVLGFPCNQFAGQEPGDSEQIADFCQTKYDVDFQMFEKIDVNGKNAHPLYKYLTQSAPGVMGSKAIKWNFTKFLIDRQGKVIERFAPNVKPEDIAPAIELLL
jgi:glutathione peroxidase